MSTGWEEIPIPPSSVDSRIAVNAMESIIVQSLGGKPPAEGYFLYVRHGAFDGRPALKLELSRSLQSYNLENVIGGTFTSAQIRAWMFAADEGEEFGDLQDFIAPDLEYLLLFEYRDSETPAGSFHTAIAIESLRPDTEADEEPPSLSADSRRF